MPTFTDTKTTLGEAGALDALVAHDLTEFADSDITLVGANAFQNQTQMETLYLPKIKQIGTNAFQYCSGMKNFYIGTDNATLTTLTNANAFTGTGRALIRVPDDLVTNYRSATNWSVLSGRIYGENDSTAPTWNETAIADSLATFISHVNNGTAADRYGLGQYITIDLGTEGQIRFQIVGKNMRELANSTDTAQLEFLAMDALNMQHRMNPGYVSGTEGTGAIGGYDKSEMKTYIDTDIWALFPTDWQNIIKETKIKTRIYNTSNAVENNVETTAKLRLPSAREVGITNYETEGPAYTFAFPEDAERIRRTAGTTSGTTWWLRSAYNSTNNWNYVNINGDVTGTSATISISLVLGFSV